MVVFSCYFTYVDNLDYMLNIWNSHIEDIYILFYYVLAIFLNRNKWLGEVFKVCCMLLGGLEQSLTLIFVCFLDSLVRSSLFSASCFTKTFHVGLKQIITSSPLWTLVMVSLVSGPFPRCGLFLCISVLMGLLGIPNGSLPLFSLLFLSAPSVLCFANSSHLGILDFSDPFAKCQKMLWTCENLLPVWDNHRLITSVSCFHSWSLVCLALSLSDILLMFVGCMKGAEIQDLCSSFFCGVEVSSIFLLCLPWSLWQFGKLDRLFSEYCC